MLPRITRARCRRYSARVSYGWRRQDGLVVEICDECGFDGRRVADVAGGLRVVLGALDVLLRDHDVDRRPEPETWSAAEYVAHSIEVVRESVMEVAEVAGLTVDVAATDCLGMIAAVDVLIGGLADRDRELLLLEAPFATMTATGVLLHALHDLEHHVLDIRRGYARFGLARGEDLQTAVR
jgi:hypothetical protein